MMRQLKHEVYKVLGRGVFWGLLLAMLAACTFFYLNGQQHGPKQEFIEAYRAMAADYAGQDSTEMIDELTEKEKELELLQLKASQAAEPDNPVWQLLLELAQMDNPERYERVMAEEELADTEEITALVYACREIKTFALYRQNYPQFLAAVQDNAESMKGSVLFGKPGTYHYNNILKTAADFAGLEEVEISPGIGDGITSVTGFLAGDMLIVLMVFVLAVFLFYEEYRKGLFLLVRSYRKGRGATIAAKLGAMLLLTLGLTLIYAALMMGLGAWRYGFGVLGRSLQSVSAFRNSTLRITVGQYLALSFCVKYLVFAGVACLFSFVFTVFKSNVTSAVLAGFLPLVVGWLLYTLLPGSFIFNHLKYINPFYYLDCVKLLGEYQNLNFFTLPISAKRILPVYLGLAWVLLSTGAVLRFVTDRTVSRPSLWERIWERLRRRKSRRYHSAALLPAEGYKFFVQEKAALLLAALLLGSVYLVSQNADITFREEEQVYRKYLYRLSGRLTEEKQEYYHKLEVEYTEAEAKGRNDYRLAGFKLVQQDYAYLQELESRGIKPAFVDQLSGKIWLSAEGAEVKNALLFLAAVVLLTSALYGSDIKRNMLPLLKSTPEGRKQLARVKVIWAFMAVLLCYGAVYLPFYLYVYRNVGGLPLEASLQSFQAYSQQELRGSIGGLLTVKLLLELLHGFAAAALTMYLTLRIRNRVTAMLAGLGVTCLPLALQSKGIELRWYSLNQAFLLGTTLERGNITGKLLLQESVILCLTILCLAGIRREMESKCRRSV